MFIYLNNNILNYILTGKAVDSQGGLRCTEVWQGGSKLQVYSVVDRYKNLCFLFAAFAFIVFNYGQ